MHKKIKYIIAASLVISAVSGFLPANNFKMGATEAYAATYKAASTGELSSLALNWNSGKSEIKLRDSYSGDEVDLTSKNEYYAEVQGINVLNIAAEVKGSGYVVKVFTSGSKTEEGKDVGDDIKLNSNYKTIYLRTYKSEDAYKEAYNNGDVSDSVKTYIIHVKKETTSSDTEQDREYAYLDGIHLSDGHIDFSKSQTDYSVNVDENVDTLTVRAEPDDDEDYIKINDESVDKDHDFETTVKLDKGNNTITIYVEHDDEDETYTLNVYRGKKDTATTSGQTFTVQTEGNTLNAWQRFDGKWRYIDGTGTVKKNQWWFDTNTGIRYHLDENGYRTIGWYSENGKWYHFNDNGEMQTGWVSVKGQWYFLDVSGVMKLGWLGDSSGNWYYLDGSGAMKTGWVESSDGKWYYLDATGKMVKNSVVEGNTLDSNGAMA
ncbi:cadherin-like beta sandwich domain-containing protein [Clostridium sp. YIM B02555]|uniref:cadherin-like beta sandwich domain-containing protein n=1 Tax=Clostridium sp. YIM B02555 TaxID=2911968 RepID=UPI001EED7F5B|nr:cadherin-like beta sandwich domain-containing protein [Clostridium sp. YIM B02555]